MPIRLEQIRQPTAEDWADLEKIHKDTQSEGLTLSQESIQSWLNAGGLILGGRFNDRLVGMALAKDQQEESVLLLTQAAVRAVTQRRGVMHQLIELTKSWAKENKRSVIIPQVPEHLCPALEKRSFKATDGVWRYTPES